MSEQYCMDRHDNKICLLANCKYNNILKGDFKELLGKLDAICFNYKHVDYLYTLFKYRFSGEIVVKSGQLFDIVQRAVHFNQTIRKLARKPSIAENRRLSKKYKKIEFLPKNKIDGNQWISFCTQS